MQGFRPACRSLARQPGFAAAVFVMLALTVGASAAVFSVVDTVLLKPLPYPDPDRLVTVMEADPGGGRESLVAPARLEDWDRRNRTFVAISGSYSESVTDTSGTDPERLAGKRVAPRYFTVFGVQARVGRTLAPEEERFGGPAAAVISEGLWTRRYGRDPGILSRALLIGGTRWPIVGVMPAAFADAATDVWLPAQTAPALMRIRQARFFSGVGRIRAGVPPASATADLARVQQSLEREYPATDKGWSVRVSSLREVRVGSYREGLVLVFGAVMLLLGIAVANIAGLMLVQFHRRARDLAVRQALGGSRLQIVGGILPEIVLLTAAGLSAGIGIAWSLTRIAGRTFSALPRATEFGLDGHALLFAVAVVAVSAIVFGVVPALHVTRRDPAALLATAGGRLTGRRHALQQLLVAGQVALGLLVAASAGLLVRSYYNLLRVDTGFRPANVITFHVGAAWNEDRARVGRMQQELLGELRRQPEIADAGLTSFLPATGATLRYDVRIAGASATEENGTISVGTRNVSAGYLRAISVPLVAGSVCPPLRLDYASPMPAVVNRAFADRYGAAVGRHFTFDQLAGDYEIVGVIGNTIEDGPRSSPTPYVYLCQPAGEWPDPDYVVLARGDRRQAFRAIRDAVHRTAPGRALFGLRMMEDVIDASLDQPRWNAEALSLFAGAAIALAAVGLYSVLMLLVTERRREIGIRIALGARPTAVALLVLLGAGRMAVAGIAAGLALVWATSRLLAASLFAVGALDVRVLAATVVGFAIVTLLATAVPARLAVRTDAISSIRSE